jgi:hypothetical protein
MILKGPPFIVHPGTVKDPVGLLPTVLCAGNSKLALTSVFTLHWAKESEKRPIKIKNKIVV